MQANPKIARWSNKIDPRAPAAIVIDRFGGLSRFCEATGYPTSTVHDWLVKGLIPQPRWNHIKARSNAMPVPVGDHDFLDQRNG